MDNNFLNRLAVRWLADHFPNLAKKNVLVAAPYDFKSKKWDKYVYPQRRCIWNVHTHGDERKTSAHKDVVLVQIAERPKDASYFDVTAVYHIPHEIAAQRKTIAVYDAVSRKRRGSWVDEFKVFPLDLKERAGASQEGAQTTA